MDILQAIKERHSVRSYLDKAISAEILAQLQAEISDCNQASNLNIQLVANHPKAFDGMMARYGKFYNVQNYIALIGKKGANLEETIGYYGERLALKAQMLGLNTCWVAFTFSKEITKKQCHIGKDEKLICVLALGYGANLGVPHTSKDISEVIKVSDTAIPDWFKNGVQSALLAPTSMNQQKFMFELVGDGVHAKSTGGIYSKIDLGIVKYHFEQGAALPHLQWV